MPRASSVQLAIFASFLSAVPAGATVGVVRTTQNSLRLEGDCVEVRRELSGLITWTQKLEDRVCATPAVEPGSEGDCVADVTVCVPAFVRQLHGLTSEAPGPNCWNMALVTAGLLPSLRESSSEEWRHTLDSPLCRELGSNEKVEAGDLGSIETRARDSVGEVHGFTYLTETLVFDKRGIALRAPYLLESVESMLKSYPLGKFEHECRDACGDFPLSDFLPPELAATLPEGLLDPRICPHASRLGIPELNGACAKHRAAVESSRATCQESCALKSLHRYRCTGWPEYLGHLAPRSGGLAREALGAWKTLEAETSRAVFATGTVRESALVAAERQLERIHEMVGSPANSALLSDPSLEFLRTTLVDRLRSMQSTLQILGRNIRLSEAFQTVENRLRGPTRP